MKTSKPKMNCKGASSDNIYVVILFFMIAVSLLVYTFFWDSVSQVNVIWSQPQAGQAIRDRGQSFMDTLDTFALFAWIGLHLVIIGLAYLLRTHPVLWLGGFFFTILLLLISPVISNGFETIITNSVFTSTAAQYPIMTFIMAHLPFLELVWAVLTLIFTYGFAGVGDE